MAGASRILQLHPDLEDLRRQFVEIGVDAQRLVEGLSEAQFNWRPSPGQWSIAECLAHLNLVDGSAALQLAPVIEHARSSGPFGSGVFRYGRITSWMIRKTEPPVKTKLPAPKQYVPPPDQRIDDVMMEFQRVQGRVMDLVVAANGLDLARVKVPTPISVRIRMSVAQRFRLTAAHDRRHLYQARQVKAQLP